MNKRYVVCLSSLLLLAVILRVYVSFDGYLHCWDERYHALVAKHMLLHPFQPTLYEYPLLSFGIDNWTANHIWLHKQPLSLWAIAASLKIFGMHEVAIRLPSVLLSTVSVWLCADVGRILFNRRVGMLAGFFYAVSGIALDLVSARMATDHPDVFVSFFILLGIYAGIRASEQPGKHINIWSLIAGLSAGAALLSKWLPGLMVFPVIFLFRRQQKAGSLLSDIRFLLIPMSLALAVFLPWQFYIQTYFPQEAAFERHYNYLHFFQALEGQSEPWYYFLDRMRIDYGELVYLPLLAAIAALFKGSGRNISVLLLWIAIPLLVFSIAATKMPAYLFPAAPAFFLLSAVYTDRLIVADVWPSLPFLRKLLIVGFLILPLRYCLERAKFFGNQDRHPQWVADIKSWGKSLPDNGARYVLLGYKAPVEAMFYTDCIAYDYFPDESVVRDWQQKGLQVVFAGEIPGALKQLTGTGRYNGAQPNY